MPRIDITPNQFRFRKFSPKKCSPGSFRIKKIGKNIQLVICCPKSKWSTSRQKCLIGTKVQSVRVARKLGMARAKRIAAKF